MDTEEIKVWAMEMQDLAEFAYGEMSGKSEVAAAYELGRRDVLREVVEKCKECPSN